MTELIDELLRLYLDVGYTDMDAFWDASIQELILLLEAASRRIKREQQIREAETKQRAVIARVLSYQIGEVVGAMFSKDKKDPVPMSKYYPGLFPEPKPREMAMEDYQALFLDFAYRHNARNARIKPIGGDVHEQRRYDAETVAGHTDGQQHAVAERLEAGGAGDEHVDDQD